MKGMMDRPKFLETKLKQVKQNMWFRTLYPVGAKICAFCAYTSTCKATKWKEVHYQKVQGTPFPTRWGLINISWPQMTMGNFGKSCFCLGFLWSSHENPLINQVPAGP